MNRIYTVLSAILLISLVSCNGSKGLTKKAVQLEEVGMIEEAAEKYYMALRKKRNNVEAQMGMKSTGQLVLNKLLTDFSSQKNFGKKYEAIQAYHTAKEFQKKIKDVGVNLSIADFYEMDYDGVKNSYMDDLYEEGTQFLEEEKYADAEFKFKEIIKLDPNYKDANDLQNIAFVEPLYQKGIEALDQGLYRTAYNELDKIKNRVGTYKEALDFRQEALDLGRFPIAIFPFENGTSEQGIDAKISAYALEALTNVNDPFVSIVDRENLTSILEEQHLSLSGLFNEETALNVGELTGARAILTGTVLDYTFDSYKAKTYDRDGYEKYKVKKTDSEGNVTYQTKYKEVKYREVTNSARLDLHVQYKMISLETGEILFTKIAERRSQDNVRYVIYDGDRKNFYPAKLNGGVNTSNSARNELHRLMDSRKKLKGKSDMASEVFEGQKNEIIKLIEDELRLLIH